MRSINKKALQAALKAHGVTVDPLRIIILRVFGTQYAQRLKDMDVICGQPLNLKERLKELQVEADKASQGGKQMPDKEETDEKTAPVATRLPRVKAAGGGRRSGKRKPKARVEASPEREASPKPDTDDDESEHGDAMSDVEDDEDTDTTMANDVGWLHALLMAEAALLQEEHGKEAAEFMYSLISHLHVRPLIDKELRATKAPTFTPPRWLLKRGNHARLAKWKWLVSKVVNAIKAGARVLGFEVVLQRPGQTARVLFACFGEVANSLDHLGRHAILSYVDSDRGVLPDHMPSGVSSAINRACMLAMVVKLSRCGAEWLWLSACSPEWWYCDQTRKIYAEPFLVATSGRKHPEDVPLSATDKQVGEMMANAKKGNDAKLRDVVYPQLLNHGQRFGIMAHGAGPWLAAPGKGDTTPTFIDDVFTKRALQPCEEDHASAPPGSSFLDAELAASNNVAQMFSAQLAPPNQRLSEHAQSCAAAYVHKMTQREKVERIWRTKKLERYCTIAMQRSVVPDDCFTLDELARHELRRGYLVMQKSSLSP